MGARVSHADHIEHGTALDIETIVRIRPWVEDIVKEKFFKFSKSELITDYDPINEIFLFKILFFK